MTDLSNAYKTNGAAIGTGAPARIQAIQTFEVKVRKDLINIFSKNVNHSPKRALKETVETFAK